MSHLIGGEGDQSQSLVERFSTECRKISTTVKQKGQCHKEHVTGLKRGKTRVTKSRLVLVFAADWLTRRREFFDPITERSKGRRTRGTGPCDLSHELK